MADPQPKASSRERVRQHRERLRRQGLRPIQIWVPDVRSPAFKAEALRQSARVAAAADEAETMDFIEAVADPGEA
ncbi:MAG TPA: antitoxin MazE family protein [Alphaproteobacteria bacterium]|nr:antitoxin MazE family protein [Alphaproteobacteria bacterium]